MTGERLDPIPFQDHIEFLKLFLADREEIIERVQGLLNAQRKPVQYLQDGALLSRHFEDCLFGLAAVTHDQARLRGRLRDAHRAGGFRPREMPGVHNDLADPGEMMVRAFHLWRQTRWPGRNGRIRYAHTLFNLYVLRDLELLSMRMWDAGSAGAAGRLTQIQAVLDHLWRDSPADQPVLVRDARWLIPLAQSPTTDDLAPYFGVAERIADSLSAEDRIEIHRAAVETAGGHLRSQLRHYTIKKGVSLDESSLLLSSRNSNALDFALLVQGLVPLLSAYEQALEGGDHSDRLALADAICQGISADPELFVNRIDLLGAYSMIEHLFVATDRDGHAAYTPTGQRHVLLLQEYAARIGRLAKPLCEDCTTFRPSEGTYSPYGMIFGFSSNLTEHIALKAVQSDSATRFTLEDAFSRGDADKLAWVNGWRKLPHIGPDVQKLFDYPQRFAQDVFARVEKQLRCACEADRNPSDRTGRLFALPADDPRSASKVSGISDLPIRYIGSSDPRIVAAQEAHAYDRAQLLRDRQEGMFLVSYETSNGWVAISKDVLTDVLGAGRDVKVAGLPTLAVEVLNRMCPGLIGSLSE